MSDRSELLAFWRSRLQASQEQALQGSARLRWLRWMYVRVYRFLLSQYGEADADVARAPEPPPSGMTLVDNTPDHFGRPPKPPGKIQAILKDIHNANERLDKPGPLARGLPDECWLVVASRREKWIPHRCLKVLRRHGVPARLVRRNGDLAVEVARDDLEIASRLLHQRRSDLTYTKRTFTTDTSGGLIAWSTSLGASLGLAMGGLAWCIQHAPGGEALDGPIVVASTAAFGAFTGLWLAIYLIAEAKYRPPEDGDGD